MPLYFAGPLTEDELGNKLRQNKLAAGCFVVVNSGLDWCLHTVGYRCWYQWLKFALGFGLWFNAGCPSTAIQAESYIQDRLQILRRIVK